MINCFHISETFKKTQYSVRCFFENWIFTLNAVSTVRRPKKALKPTLPFKGFYVNRIKVSGMQECFLDTSMLPLWQLLHEPTLRALEPFNRRAIVFNGVIKQSSLNLHFLSLLMLFKMLEIRLISNLVYHLQMWCIFTFSC